MPREKKQKLKKRPDGRYVCRYHNQFFYAYTQDECLRLRDEFKAAEKRGIIGKYFVKDYAEDWLARSRPDVAITTKTEIKNHIAKLTGTIGDLPVSDVKPSDIKTVFTNRYTGMSASYIKHARHVFYAIFDSAVADGIITRNPARDRTAKPHKGKVGGNRAITEQEREWILTYCTTHRAYPAIMAMLYAGLRPQEAKAILIERDVDFVADTITVRETAHTDPEDENRYQFTEKGKTEQSNRVIPLLPPLKSVLQGRTGLLIPSAHGEMITKCGWRSVWSSYVSQMEAEINGVQRRWYGRTAEQKELRDNGALPPWISFTVKPYDLRHSFCTMCRSMQPPIELHTLMHWMGHADSRMILAIYDSVTDNRDKAESNRLKSAFQSQNGSQSESGKPATIENTGTAET